jgi:hypothetical protein
MRPGTVLILGLALAAALVPVTQAARGPSTPKERAKALKLIRQLEEDPGFDGAREARSWLSLWLFEVPDLHVDLCPELLGGTAAERKRIPAEVTTQLLYSGAGYLIEHKDGPREAVYLAGVQGALKVYESMLAARPHIRSALLDGLIGRREAGTLAAHVSESMAACPLAGLKAR